MSYQSRRRYTGRGQRFREHMRVYRLVWLFGLLFLAAWVAFNWRWLYDYGRTYFMD